MPSKDQETGTRTTTDRPVKPSQMISDAATLQAYGFNTMTGMGVAWVEALSDIGSEVLSFVADRIREDVKTQHRLLHCKDMGELQQIQTEFMQTAIEQYRAETGKLVEMSRDLMHAPNKDGNGN